MAIAPRVAILLFATTACVLHACVSPAPAGDGRGGRGGGAGAGRGSPDAVGQRGRGARRGGAAPGEATLGRGRGRGNLNGVQLRRYRFAETGEWLDYAVYVSSRVRGGTRSPLVIVLHGRGVPPTTPMRFVRDAAESAGFIAAAPMGYHERAWYGLYESERTTPARIREYSEKDVMNVLSMMRAEFDVDSNRIYLMGSSMGGAGTLHLAAKHPQLWAAVGVGAPPIRRGAVDYTAIRHIPVMLVHGDNDAAVRVDISRSLDSLFKALDMTYQYREIRGGSHGNALELGAPMMISFFERHRKGGFPTPAATRSDTIR